MSDFNDFEGMGSGIHSSIPNVFGGVDVYHGSSLHHTTIPNVYGGVDVYGEDMQMEGMTMPNVYGGEDYMSLMGNSTDVMNFDDPLAHVNELKLPSFDITKY